MPIHAAPLPIDAPFHGTLVAGRHTWHVYFLDVARQDGDWVIECAVAGPGVRRATIRCKATISHGDTARRAMSALREWLLSGDPGDEAYLEVGEPEVLSRAS